MIGYRSMSFNSENNSVLPFDSMSMSPKEASRYLKKNTKFKFFNKLKLNKQRSKRDTAEGEIEEMQSPLLKK